MDDLKLRMLRLDTGLTRGLSFSGKPIAAQYIYDLGTSGTLTNTFENTLYAAKALAEISVPAGHTMIFNGPILMDPSPTVTNFCFNFTGPGTKIVNGGMTIDSIACHANYTASYELRFSAGTTIIRSDVTVPCMQVSNGTKLVITNGATVKLIERGLSPLVLVFATGCCERLFLAFRKRYNFFSRVLLTCGN